MTNDVIAKGELVREKILNLYKKNEFLYKELEEEVKYTLERNLKEKEIKIHSILSRIKEFDSLFDKIERKQTNNPFEDITDIVGTRVVCLFLSDIDKIKSCLQDSFNIISEDNKVHGDNVSSFGYMSVHFIAMLKDEYCGPRYDYIKNLKFEIQVRTISMDAWANISHYLDYKSENDVPSELKRDFHALSGLFYVADTHFETFVNASHQSQINKDKEVKNMLSTGNNSIDNEKLDFDTLKSYLKEKFKDRTAPVPPKHISLLLEELLENGYSTLSKLDSAIDKASEAFKAYEIKYYPAEGSTFASVGVARISLCLVDENYKRILGDGSVLDSDERFKDPEIVSLIK
ncbi:GTP pyrophosphokinase [Bacillus tropicus]|uniref:GTP pyrophosphokinase n=1 Tax=Bacillus tropicus TaxID=2026188 RepID=UPI0034E4B75E